MKLDHAYVDNPCLLFFGLPLETSRDGVPELAKEAKLLCLVILKFRLYLTWDCSAAKKRHCFIFVHSGNSSFCLWRNHVCIWTALSLLVVFPFQPTWIRFFQLFLTSPAWYTSSPFCWFLQLDIYRIHFVMNTDGNKSVSVLESYSL